MMPYEINFNETKKTCTCGMNMLQVLQTYRVKFKEEEIDMRRSATKTCLVVLSSFIENVQDVVQQIPVHVRQLVQATKQYCSKICIVTSDTSSRQAAFTGS